MSSGSRQATCPGREHPDLLAADFTFENVSGLRREVAERARTSSLSETQLGSFVLAVAEILANAIVHGGGSGSLRLWRSDVALHCRVSDTGPGIPTERLAAPAGLPPLSAAGGRGLWLARQFCQVDITASPAGTTVDLATPVPAAA